MKLPFSYITFFIKEAKNVVGEEGQNFGWVTKILSDESFARRSFPDKVIVFLISVVTPSKIRTAIYFYVKVLSFSPEKHFRGYRGFGFHLSN